MSVALYVLDTLGERFVAGALGAVTLALLSISSWITGALSALKRSVTTAHVTSRDLKS